MALTQCIWHTQLMMQLAQLYVRYQIHHTGIWANSILVTSPTTASGSATTHSPSAISVFSGVESPLKFSYEFHLSKPSTCALPVTWLVFKPITSLSSVNRKKHDVTQYFTTQFRRLWSYSVRPCGCGKSRPNYYCYLYSQIICRYIRARLTWA